jgi:UDP-GlcNAc3NAcA epimerase
MSKRQKKICTIVGARPQFVKAGLVSRALAGRCSEVMVHTGQHYDYEMSEVFFKELGLRQPQYNLNVGSGGHGAQTGKMLQKIEAVLSSEKPDYTLVYGDTNSTLAGALASVKLGIPVAHVEAGLRSFNRQMPEEINRILTDRISALLFCPTATAVKNLKKEGISDAVYNVGDVMYDLALFYGCRADSQSRILAELGLVPGRYSLLTIHRAGNTDNKLNLLRILGALALSSDKIVFPAHPRTRKALSGANIPGNIKMIPPVGYLDMVELEKNAAKILTDSGGVQKEAYFFQVPCITLREETEWVETLTGGWNVLVGSDPAKIGKALAARRKLPQQKSYFGRGDAHKRIVEILLRSVN